ncbi:hypothetical protein ALC53_01609 [Atta colombica]|uniref:Uncharacterized protein n=1 Tax=Atta colombica TaxID=520822 RepID=A0A195BV24_9HYME|nr:hypothetical protein ALC53_01609 [Atta colombica]
MSRNSPDYTCAPFSGSGVHSPRARKTIRDTRGLSNRRLSSAYRACKKERRYAPNFITYNSLAAKDNNGSFSLFLKHNKKMILKTVVLPFVCFLVITFHLVCCSNTIKTTDSKNHVVNNFNGEIATWIIHIRNMAPAVCRRFIFFSTAHPRYSVKSSFMKKIVSFLIINKNNNVK